MKSILNALQDGRLVELPDTDKEKSLRYLAHLIEAIPELGSGLNLDEEVLKVENSNNTSIGSGVACPHVRAAGNGGDLICAVGWSPQGVDYGARDGKKVHLVVMYYIPEAQKNTYLKEISSLVRAMQKEGEIQAIAGAKDIATVREQLLDWVSAAIEAGMPEARARMIRLETRQAAIAGTETPLVPEAPGGRRQTPMELLPVLFVTLPGEKYSVVCKNPELASALENEPGLGSLLKLQAQFERQGFRLIHRATTLYDPARPVYDYLAVKTA